MGPVYSRCAGCREPQETMRSWYQWTLLTPISLKGKGGCWNLKTKRLCGERHFTENIRESRMSQCIGRYKERGGVVNTQASVSSLALIPANTSIGQTNLEPENKVVW